MKKLIVAWLLCFAPFFLMADKSDTIGNDSPYNNDKKIRQDQFRHPLSKGGGHGKHRKEWTVIMYWDGDDNDIQTDLLNAFDEMVIAQAGSTDQVNIIIQFDRYPGKPDYGGWSITHRFFLTPGMEPTETNSITDWRDKQGGGREVDMSNPAELRDFIKWAARNYPAKHYALIVADHGFGWKGLAIDNTNYKRIMSIKQFSKAINESGVHIDLLSLDDCLMQMVEVAHELRSSGVDILVGSEASGRTWPYSEILGSIMQKPWMSGEEIGEMIVDSYISSHPDQTDITLSVVQLSRIEALTAAIKELSSAILNDMLLETVKDKAVEVIERIDNAVIYKNNAPDWRSAGGISIYFPPVGPIPLNTELLYFYKSQNVKFSEDALWHNLLTSCYGYTPSKNCLMLVDIRYKMNSFDDDKVDLYDLCNSIIVYTPDEFE